MQPSQSPFPLGWWGTHLGDVRRCRSTYCLFTYESLPPLDSGLFDGTLTWLGINQPVDQPFAGALASLTATLDPLGLKLPAAFINIISSTSLQRLIPTYTGCYFDLSSQAIKSPLGDDGYFIRFFNDQQDAPYWYLYLSPTLGEAVVVSGIEALDDPYDAPTPEEFAKYLWFCAPTVEEFLYRIWIENTICASLYPLYTKRPLTEVEEAYLKHYQSN